MMVEFAVFIRLSVLDKLRHKLFRNSLRGTGCCKKFFHSGQYQNNRWNWYHELFKNALCSNITIFALLAVVVTV